jgi:hypothetical protein
MEEYMVENFTISSITETKGGVEAALSKLIAVAS